MKIIVNVTQEDIDRGSRHCGTECPVLWALQRAFSPDVIDRVTRAYIVFRDRPRKKSPKSVVEFCRNFDCGGPDEVGPIRFTVTI
jgi:hypothetical protein